MGIPILNELNDELTRLYIAGSPLAKGDPRVARYVAPLEKLGERAPVFKALAARLEALLSPQGEKASPQNLMEAGMLLQSVLYTQGDTAIGETLPMEYAHQDLAVPKTPYSRLWEMQEILRTGSQSHTDVFRLAYEAGQHNDPRLYRSYVEAVTDNRSYISNYVADVILPSLGADILPFLLESLDLAGGKRNARLVRIVHTIQGKEALPLAEQILAGDAAPHVVAEALHILAEDPGYEDTLLSYTKDKKGELRQAAFAALTRMGSQKGEASLLEALEKASVTALEDALIASQSPAVAAAVLAQAKACMKDYKKNAAKLKVLLRVVATRDEGEGLEWLEGILSDAKLYAEAVSVLELHPLLQLLLDCDTPDKNQLLLRISQGDGSRLYFKLAACVRLYDAAQVFDLCHKDVKRGKGYSGYTNLTHAYGLNWGDRIPDDRKTWDRRWSPFYSKMGNVTAGYLFLYEDDHYAWKHLLEAVAGLVKNQGHRSAAHGEILAHAFRAGYPDARKYYDKFLKNGFQKERLVEYVGEFVSPGQQG